MSEHCETELNIEDIYDVQDINDIKDIYGNDLHNIVSGESLSDNFLEAECRAEPTNTEVEESNKLKNIDNDGYTDFSSQQYSAKFYRKERDLTF